MPRDLVSLTILRKTSVPDDAGGYTQTEAAITGSPFIGRVFRRGGGETSGFIPGTPGETNADYGVIVSFEDVSVGVEIDDVVNLPNGTRARVIRVRQYTNSVQCDTVVGAD